MLRSVRNKNFVLYIDNTGTVLGRNRVCKVKNPKCSKEQVRIAYDKKAGVIMVTQLGRRRSVLAGRVLCKGDIMEMRSGDVLELLPNRHMFRLEMEHAQKPSQTSLKSFFVPNFQTCTSEMQHRWVQNGTLFVYSNGAIESNCKVAAFDLDGTLITTRSGRVFPRDGTDWKLWNRMVVKKLRQFHSESYRIVVFTNQRALSKHEHLIKQFQFKMRCVAESLGVPLTCFVSTQDDVYRKPKLGMWQRFCQVENGGVQVDFHASFYVGDAAGRSATDLRKADHSSDDIQFAINAKLTFKTPEEFFFP